jgi:hypothetical protein
MRVLFVSDRSFSDREHGMLRRLEIGLLDEGAQLVRAMPASREDADDTQLTRVVTFPDVGPRLMRPFRIAQMLERLAPLSRDPSKPPSFDIVHAWGDRCWVLARELASMTDAELVIEVWSKRSLDRIRAFERSAAQLATMGRAAAWSAADQVLADRARKLASWPVHANPWGVHVPVTPRKPTEANEPTPIVVLPEGHDQNATVALLRGLAQAMKDQPGERPLILLGEAAVRGTRTVWKAVESLGLADITTVLADGENRREPVLLAEILALPEACGEHRSIALEAMAAGQVVMPLRDPLVEYYRHDRTCFTVDAATPHCWELAFRELLHDPAKRRRIGLGARTWIEKHRRVHPHVTSLLTMYETLRNKTAAPLAR